MTDDAAGLNAAGLRALSQGQVASAVALLRRAVVADPASPLLFYNLATALHAAGDAASHETAVDEALTRDPYFAHALLAKARLLETRGDGVGAITHYQRLIAALDPAAPMGPGFAAGVAHARAVLQAANDALEVRLETVLGDRLDAESPQATERFRHAVEIGLGRRRIYHPQPLVLAYPYLPPVQFFDRAHFPWLSQLEAATPVIRAELQALLAAGDAGFAPYVAYPPGAPVNQWATLNHSDAWAAQFLIQHGIPNAAIRARCPRTAALLDTLPLFDLPGRGPVAFFSLLKPHTHIPPHTGATNIRTIVHLPLIVPELCGFRVGNDSRPWVEGQAFAFDDSIEHEARNGSDKLRAVLIIDTWNPYLTPVERDLLRDYVAVLDAQGRSMATFGAG
ncbi:aspartyl/asparaginyl beta-hydroxylase domain-containing protein [Polymorphobacter fuscus]|uniref:aspartyl/asparaginyl beta-hydroxylase domain-containing protein n=1 Tax=Sandarakinorhabdus fusca TaxID=1439888 RepID=UPI001431A564|nr:aspartyl/asparaginyl beta-hydroxylase domain-containing protein [Polymorphobacter fuscus]NJC08328.1 aspartyl/asparaginyl beta-hydroxylase (cupin superfamily) [Polymorphobacter fuscus]